MSPLKTLSFGDSRWPTAAVLLHGFLGSGADWDGIVSELVNGEIFCITVDLPYHGGSQNCTALSVSDAAFLIVSELERYSLRHFFLIGYSLGGRIALTLAQILKPDGCILISVEPGYDCQQLRDARFESDKLTAQKIKDTPLNDFLDDWYSLPMWGPYLKQKTSYSELMRRRLGGNSAEALGAAMTAFSVGTTESNWPWLKSNERTVPCLYLCGSTDEKYSTYCRQLSKYVHTVSVSGAGHNIVFEKSFEVSHACLLFLWRYSGNPIRSSGLETQKFRLPLTRTMTVGKEVISHREGLLLSARGQFGARAYGEISPLPGFHPENVDDCFGEVCSLADQFDELNLQRKSLAVDNGSLLLTIDALAGNKSLSGCSVVGLEMLLLHLSILNTKLSASQAFAALCGNFILHVQDTVKLNGVVPRSIGDAFDLAQGLAKSGFGVLKLKVAHRSVREDAILFNQLSDSLAGVDYIKLRLDANKMWKLDEACDFVTQLTDTQKIEYIEEPVQDADDLAKFFEITGVPVAIDESLSENKELLAHLPAKHGVSALVVKPGLLGGITESYRLTKAGHAVGIGQTVLSSAFESGLTLAWLSVFANEVDPTTKSHHGLGTFNDLANDVCSPSFASLCEAGRLSVSRCDLFIKRFRPNLERKP